MTTDETEAAGTPAAAPEPTAPKARASTPSKAKAKPSRSRAKGPNDVEFRFTGNPAIGMAGIPAADLTQADVDRIVYRSTIPEPGIRGLSRGQRGFSQARAKVVRVIVATGNFTKRS